MEIALKCIVFELCGKEQLSYRLTFGAKTYKKNEFIEIDENFYRKSYQIVLFNRVIKIYSDVDKNKLFSVLSDNDNKFLIEFIEQYSTSNHIIQYIIFCNIMYNE